MPVELFDQTTLPVVQVAVKVNGFGEQTTNWLGGVTVGTLGFALISRLIGVLASESQPFEVHFADIE